MSAGEVWGTAYDGGATRRSRIQLRSRKHDPLVIVRQDANGPITMNRDRGSMNKPRTGGLVRRTE